MKASDSIVGNGRDQLPAPPKKRRFDLKKWGYMEPTDDPEKQARLRRAAYSRQRWANLSYEERQKRLEQNAAYKRNQRKMQSPEQQEVREKNAKDRREHRKNLSPEDWRKLREKEEAAKRHRAASSVSYSDPKGKGPAPADFSSPGDYPPDFLDTPAALAASLGRESSYPSLGALGAAGPSRLLNVPWNPTRPALQSSFSGSPGYDAQLPSHGKNNELPCGVQNPNAHTSSFTREAIAYACSHTRKTTSKGIATGWSNVFSGSCSYHPNNSRVEMERAAGYKATATGFLSFNI